VFVNAQQDYFLLKQDGQVWTGSDPYLAKSVLPQTDWNLKSLAFFEDCTYALSEDGNLYRLDVHGQKAACPLTSLGNVSQFASTQTHAVFVMKHGDAFAWGANSFGQCGVSPKHQLFLDVPVKVLSDVKQCVCWNTGTAFLTSQDVLYTGRVATVKRPLAATQTPMKVCDTEHKASGRLS
jgi:hypothetical protein